MRRFRSALVSLLLALALPVAAQLTPPPKLEPVPEPPPPPPGYQPDPALEPSVTITTRGEEKLEEYRINGKLYMVKVTPPRGGTPYYLIDSRGDGRFVKQEPLDSGLRVPHWVIGTF